MARLRRAYRAAEHHAHAVGVEMPEFNPIENIWRLMRDICLSNRIFRFYEDILDHCCFAWTVLSINLGASRPSGDGNGPMRHDLRDLVLPLLRG
jgi:hypothetical protein